MRKKLQQTILITRDSNQAGDFKDRLLNLGADIICIPTIKIVDPDSWESFDSVTARLDDIHWIVFTSINAVNQTARRLESLNIDLNQYNQIRIAAVGTQTAKTLENLDWTVDLVPDKFQAEDLTQKLLTELIPNQNIWIPRALVTRDILSPALIQGGMNLHHSVVYQNVAPTENKEALLNALNEKRIDWITFTSSSTVSNLFEILGESVKQIDWPKIASIGSVTSKTLEKYNLKAEFTAIPQNIDGLIAGIINHNS